MTNQDSNSMSTDPTLEQFSEIEVPSEVRQRLDATYDEFFQTSHEQDQVTHRSERKKNRFSRATIGALSLSLSVLALISWFMFSLGADARAFAQVRDAVEGMRNVIITYESKSRPEQNVKVYVLKSGAYRQEFTSGLVRIFDPDDKRSLGLEAASRTAWFSDAKRSSDPWYLIRKVMDTEQATIRSLGTREGGSLKGFLVDNDGEPVRLEIWVDAETNLPVEVTESPTKPDDPLYSHRHSTLRFKFNQTIDKELFRLSPPDGYRLVEKGPVVPMPKSPRGTDLQRLELEPGLGIGGLTWGADLSAAQELLGAPSEVAYCYTIDDQKLRSPKQPTDAAIDYLLAEYNALGLTLKFNKDGGLISVSAEAGIPDAGVRTYPGKTTEDIAIGDSLDKVLEAYGKPSRSRGPADSPFAVIYKNAGVAFGLEEGRVTGIQLTDAESR